MNLLEKAKGYFKVTSKVISKSNDELIEEIHSSFFSEVDKLHASALILNSLETNKKEMVEKYNRLISLGFNNTKEVKEAKEEIERIEVLKKENENKKSLIEAINYFSFKYPFYKFITKESVERICEKYVLVYDEISNYIGIVPDENLEIIEKFKIDDLDECYECKHNTGGYFYAKITFDNPKNIPKKNPYYDKHITYEYKKLPLEIVAPIKDFDMTEKEVKNFQIVDIPDPIVLKPVVFNEEKYYLIVTAWGLEAKDELVMNPKLN